MINTFDSVGSSQHEQDIFRDDNFTPAELLPGIPPAFRLRFCPLGFTNLRRVYRSHDDKLLKGISVRQSEETALMQ